MPTPFEYLEQEKENRKIDIERENARAAKKKFGYSLGEKVKYVANEAGETQKEIEYLVDNSYLMSRNRGVAYRAGPDVEVAPNAKVAQFGTVVTGVLWRPAVTAGEGKTGVVTGWVKAGEGKFLPTHVQDCLVLRRLNTDTDEEQKMDPKEMWKGWKCPIPPSDQNDWKYTPGTGSQYIVLPESCDAGGANQVAIRAAPSFAAPAQGRVLKGEMVELFEWDETWRWRETMDMYGLTGWMLLDHEKCGPLLRPRGLPFHKKRIEPVLLAAYENDFNSLSGFIRAGADKDAPDSGDNTPLILAAMSGACDCIVYLLNVRADASAKNKKDESAADVAVSQPTRALINALQNKPRKTWSVEEVREAARTLSPETVPLADGLLSAAGLAISGGTDGEPVEVQDRMEIGGGEKKAFGWRGGKKDGGAAPRKQEQPVERGVKHVVKVKKLALREHPDTKSEQFGIFEKGEIIEIFGTDESGLYGKARLFDGGKLGYVLFHHEKLGTLIAPLDGDDEEAI